MRVSIGIPFYNSEATLAEAIQSVFAQTFTDWELILMDDGSTDRSLRIAESVRDARVHIVSDGCNCGLPYRLNQMTQLSRGEYIARMDADDLMHPHRIAAQVAFLDAHSEVDLVDTAIFSMDTNGRLAGVRGLTPLTPTPEAALRGALLLHPTVCGRARWFRENPYDPLCIRAQDHELWCRTVAHTTFARICEPLHYYREGRVNLANYLRSARDDRTIIRTYGRMFLSRWRVWRLLCASWMKGHLYRVLTPLRADRLLVALRNQRISPKAERQGLAVLQNILSTSVPGWNIASARQPSSSRQEPRSRAA